MDTRVDKKSQIKAAYAMMKSAGFDWNQLSVPGSTPWSESKILEAGRKLRDIQLKDYPILPGAVATFIDLGSTREWACAGKVRGVLRAVEALNETETHDPGTGMVYYGLEQYTRRRAMDYVTIGRTSFAYKKRRSTKASPLEYIDPTLLRFKRDKADMKNKVKASDKIWKYARQIDYKMSEITLHHPLPMGTNRFQAPLSYVLPSAKLAWLLQEHNIAALDGRKIRDIFLVGNAAVQGAVEDAIIQQAALWAGASVSKVGAPMVHLNVPAGSDISKLFYRLGLSEIPSQFDPIQFIDMYVNQIAAAIGVSLRHFWNTMGATTNRSVEEVAERRQEHKGAASFVRSEERSINSCGFLDQFGKGSGRIRFGYIEEIDVSTKIRHAEYLERVSKALNLMAKVFGTTINMESYLAWMQSSGALPNDITLINPTPEEETSSDIKIEESDEFSAKEGEVIEEGFDSPDAFAPKSVDNPYHLDYDEVVINAKGDILDRRRKTFSVLNVLNSTKSVKIPKNVASQTAWEQALEMAATYNRTLLKNFLETPSNLTHKYEYWRKNQHVYNEELVESALDKCLDTERWNTISHDEQNVIDILLGTIEEWVGGKIDESLVAS